MPDEKHDTLRDALTRLVIGLHPLDGPRAVIHVDPAPGFLSISNNDSLKHINVSLEVGQIKNKNKNPVAEKAVQELEEELLRQEPGGGPVTETGLALATARLNSRLRHQGLSSREVWTQRSQFTNDQLPILDYNIILAKHKQRTVNHNYSAQSKNHTGLAPQTPPLQVGDIVYLYSDRDKNRARDRYIVVIIDGTWCFIKKFTGSQLRATSYKVKLSECYAVPPSLAVSCVPPTQPLQEETLTLPAEAVHNPMPPHWHALAPPQITHPFDTSQRESTPTQEITTTSLNTDLQEEPLNVDSNQPPMTVTQPVAEQDADTSPEARPQRNRRMPNYLSNYILL